MRLIDADALRMKAQHAKDIAKWDGELLVVGLGHVINAPTIEFPRDWTPKGTVTLSSIGARRCPSGLRFTGSLFSALSSAGTGGNGDQDGSRKEKLNNDEPRGN